MTENDETGQWKWLHQESGNQTQQQLMILIITNNEQQ